MGTRLTSGDVGTATVEVDALVVGAGAAGMTAALVSSLEGLDVMLCEKSDRVGGTTATSAGTIWVPHRRIHGTRRHDDWPRLYRAARRPTALPRRTAVL